VAKALQTAASEALADPRGTEPNNEDAIDDEINRQKPGGIAQSHRPWALIVLADQPTRRVAGRAFQSGKLGARPIGVIDRRRAWTTRSTNVRRLRDGPRRRDGRQALVRWRARGQPATPSGGRRSDPRRLQDIISQGLSGQYRSEHIAQAVEDAGAFSEERAGLIADTEIASANSQGSLEGYVPRREAGVR